MSFFGLKQFYTQEEAKAYFFDRQVPTRVMVQDYTSAKELFFDLTVDDQLEMICLVAERGVTFTTKWLKKNRTVPNKKMGKQIVMYAVCHGRGGLMCRTVKNFNRTKKLFANTVLQFH